MYSFDIKITPANKFFCTRRNSFFIHSIIAFGKELNVSQKVALTTAFS